MDYEKLYKNALERARKCLDEKRDTCFVRPDVIFPELQESEDERIRKALLEYFGEECDTATINGIYCYKIYAWLEKQGQVKESDISQHENKICKENDDSLTCEDEKIKKAIISYIDYEGQRGGEWFGVKVNDIIAWLEKQKYSDFDMENEYWRGYDDAKKHMEEKQLTEQKPVKWTEEDEELLQHCCGAVAAADYYTLEDKEEMEKWLKFIKKRTEEQK